MLALGIVGAVVGATALIVPISAVFVASQRAENAADAAALAAADAISGAVPGVPCALAATVASRNGAARGILQHGRPRGIRHRGGLRRRLRTRRVGASRAAGVVGMTSVEDGLHEAVLDGGRAVVVVRPELEAGRPGYRCSAFPCRC